MEVTAINKYNESIYADEYGTTLTSMENFDIQYRRSGI